MSKQMIGHTRYDEKGNLVEIETLGEHSSAVAYLCQKFGAKTGMALICRFLGLIHDIGKATDIFGKRVGVIPSKGGRIHYPHMMTGARYILEKLGDNKFSRMLASIVAGHHGGLRNWDELPSNRSDITLTRNETFQNMMSTYKANLSDIKDYAVYPEVYDMLDELSQGCLEINPESFGKTNQGADRYAGFWGLLTRLNFSRLIDADCLSTEYWYNPSNAKRRENNHADLYTIGRKLDSYVRKTCNTNGVINQWRTDIMQSAKKSACSAPGVFTMEADVGGGKTLAMLMFAVLHALNHNMERIIYVAPFGSIIEQTANIFRGIFGENNVCVHHMNMDTDKMSSESLLACENWDAPVVVSSVEQLFDSMYSYKNSRCRKIHNMANSVILIDEFHNIPLTTMWHVTHAIDALSSQYVFNSSVVLASATLPVFDCFNRTLADGNKYPLLMRTPKPIIPADLFAAPKTRVKLTYNDKLGGLDNWDSIADSAASHDQCMVIVNTRISAYKLAKCMKGKHINNVIHLSASLTPADRENILEKVLRMLKKGEQVHLVCTSIVQTGVDISFPYVYREMCGWESLHQASGRCNRNAEIDLGHCIMFPTTGNSIPGLPSIQTSAMKWCLNAVNNDPERISKEMYWKKYIELYVKYCKKNGEENNLFDKNAVETLEVKYEYSMSFETIGNKARIIEDGQQVLMVMCKESKQYIEKMEKFYSLTDDQISVMSPEKLSRVTPTKSDRRHIQRYSVNCYGSDYKNEAEQKAILVSWLVKNGYAHRIGDVVRIKKDNAKHDGDVSRLDGIYVLDKGYDPEYGISKLIDTFNNSKKK